MVKKSRKAAAKYSELSKAGKKKQRDKRSLQTGTVSVSTSREIPEHGLIKSQVSRTMPRTKSELRRSGPDYQYVRDDLRRIGMLAGIMIVVLIVLSFILG